MMICSHPTMQVGSLAALLVIFVAYSINRGFSQYHFDTIANSSSRLSWRTAPTTSPLLRSCTAVKPCSRHTFHTLEVFGADHALDLQSSANLTTFWLLHHDDSIVCCWLPLCSALLLLVRAGCTHKQAQPVGHVAARNPSPQEHAYRLEP